MRPDRLAIVNRKRASDAAVVGCQNIKVIVPKCHNLLVKLRTAMNGAKDSGARNFLIGPRLLLSRPGGLGVEESPGGIDRSVEVVERAHLIDGWPILGVA